MLEEVLWARVASEHNSVKILKATPRCKPIILVELHLKDPVTLVIKVVLLTRTDTIMQRLLKHKVII